MSTKSHSKSQYKLGQCVQHLCWLYLSIYLLMPCYLNYCTYETILKGNGFRWSTINFNPHREKKYSSTEIVPYKCFKNVIFWEVQKKPSWNHFPFENGSKIPFSVFSTVINCSLWVSVLMQGANLWWGSQSILITHLREGMFPQRSSGEP